MVKSPDTLQLRRLGMAVSSDAKYSGTRSPIDKASLFAKSVEIQISCVPSAEIFSESPKKLKNSGLNESSIPLKTMPSKAF